MARGSRCRGSCRRLSRAFGWVGFSSSSSASPSRQARQDFVGDARRGASCSCSPVLWLRGFSGISSVIDSAVEQAVARRLRAAGERQGRLEMSFPQAILDLENRSIGAQGEPTLGSALELALAEWQTGNRDRELRLHLLFLCWYCTLEPPYLTGISKSRAASTGLPRLFQDVYASFADGILNDAEVLFTVGLMAQLAPWALGDDVSTWESRSEAFRERYRSLVPAGLSPALFQERGAYGDYFAGQVVVPGGF